MSDNRFFLENDKMTNDNLDNVTLEVLCLFLNKVDSILPL